MSFINDIPESLARAAHSGTSFVPERRAKTEREGYAQTLTEDYEHFRAQAQEGGMLDLLEEEFARYRDGLRKHTIAYLHSRSRCLSTMITGPANFPTARNQKRNSISDRRLDELIEFKARARRAIISKLRPDLAPIRSSDADAIERLEVELAKLEHEQERMKQANAAIRANKKGGEAAIVDALMSLNFGTAMIQTILNPVIGRPGFQTFELSNNNANINRVKERIEKISRAQAMPVIERQGTAAKLEDDPPANRVRLFFPGKPDESIRSRLKGCGFRWAPSIGCWQAYRNPNSLLTAAQIAGVPQS